MTVSPASANPQADLLAWLKANCPEAFTEGKLDPEKLRKTLGKDAVPAETGRYELKWAGKDDCFRVIQEATTATLAPDPEASVDFDATKNLVIEGDNLQVLKALQKSYYGKVKMVYIDPPYNTGSDSFVYPDKFGEDRAAYLARAGETDEEGNAVRQDFFRSNTEDNGHYHSNWLSMMYPRLFLARNLLRKDGVIFVSIDDHEVHNLRCMMDEIFGRENFIACMVWEKGRKNDAKLISVGHEYLLVYAKSLGALRELETLWREEKPGAREIWNAYLGFRRKHGENDAAIEADLQQWFAELDKSHPAKKWSRYKRVDANGPWRDRDISWPGGGGPRYDVLHPKTGKPCKVPEAGWRFASPEEMQRQIKLGLVVFRDDHTEPPFRKAHIRPIPAEIESEADVDVEEESAEEFATQVRGSYFYKQSQVAVKFLRKLLGAKAFNNPKDHFELARLFDYATANDRTATILDFFAGSGTTAQAVMTLNAEDGGARRFICVQFPEELAEDNKDTKEAFKFCESIGKPAKISEICLERIRRAGKKVAEENPGKALDVGFRALRLRESNFRAWRSDVATAEGLDRQLELAVENVDASAKDADLLVEIALKSGLDLSATMVTRNAGDKAWYLLDARVAVCLVPKAPQALVDAVLAAKPERAVFLDRCFAGDDKVKTNAALQFKGAGVEFVTL